MSSHEHERPLTSITGGNWHVSSHECERPLTSITGGNWHVSSHEQHMTVQLRELYYSVSTS